MANCFASQNCVLVVSRDYYHDSVMLSDKPSSVVLDLAYARPESAW